MALFFKIASQKFQLKVLRCKLETRHISVQFVRGTLLSVTSTGGVRREFAGRGGRTSSLWRVTRRFRIITLLGRLTDKSNAENGLRLETGLRLTIGGKGPVIYTVGITHKKGYGKFSTLSHCKIEECCYGVRFLWGEVSTCIVIVITDVK
jgi:hypothetical protein